MSEPQPTFGKLRNFIWPIASYELKKLLPMLLMSFFISFNYNILKTAKDSIVITSAGAEILPFLKVWVVFPMALLMTAFYAKLSQVFDREKVFYIIFSLFLGFYTLFTLVLYPLRDVIHPYATADYLETVLPHGMHGFISMFKYWSFTLFYAFSELWGTMVFFVLFWGFANQITEIGEAKRFYGLFGIGANSSGIFAAQTFIWLTQDKVNPYLPFGKDAWEQTVFLITCAILLSGFLALFTFYWLNKNVDLRVAEKVEPPNNGKKVSAKLSLWESIRYLSRSRYILCIALIVITYNVVINLTEVLWKHHLRLLYPNPQEYSLYFNKVMIITGILATIGGLFLSSNCIRYFGWTVTAMITPFILLLTSLGFFSFLMFDNLIEAAFLTALGASPLAIAVFFGSAQNALSRAAKYTVFDTTKEISFLPLDTETKNYGKAAIDGVGSRLGKSGGSIIFQALLLSFGTLSASIPIVAIILFSLILIWIVAVKELGDEFNQLSENNEKIALGGVIPSANDPTL